MSKTASFDCIIIGAGPGGLQAAIHLARFNRRVLLLHRPGGRTAHARHIENFLGLPIVSGAELISIGLRQAEHFGVAVLRRQAIQVEVREGFAVEADEDMYHAPYVIAASGATENLPKIANLGRHFARNFHTCFICDGFRTMGKKTLVMGNSINSVRVSFAIQRLFSKDVSLLCVDFTMGEEDGELLKEEGIGVYQGVPHKLIGEKELEGVALSDGRIIPCQAIMAGFGMTPNDDYLKNLDLKRDAVGIHLITGSDCETSVSGLFALGALAEGHSQAIITAGQGAMAAIEINQRLLQL
jgi:thioredoxin reductase (NADPH)